MGETTTEAQAEPQGEAATEPAQGAEQKNDQAQGATTQSQGDGGEKPKNPAQEPRLSDENAKLRKQLRAFEEAEEKRKRDAMSEKEKLAADRQKFESEQAAFATQRQTFAAQQAVTAEAAKAGFRISAERVFALVKDGIEFDGDSPTNAAAVVAKLATDEPGLVGAQNGSATNPDRSKGAEPNPEDLSIDDLRKQRNENREVL